MHYRGCSLYLYFVLFSNNRGRSATQKLKFSAKIGSLIYEIKCILFRFGGNKRPDRSADGTWLDHQAWTKIVMAAGLGIIVYFTLNRPASHETPLAKSHEFLNGKRSQNSLCAPAFKTEIKKLGNLG